MPARTRRADAATRASIVGLVAAALVVSSTAAIGADAPIAVVEGPEDQRAPSVDDTYLIWTQNSIKHPHVDHAYGVALGSDQRFRLDEAGTEGVTGGIDPRDPAAHRAIYQQLDGTTSDLYWFDLDGGTRQKVGQDVNTTAWERDPRISATYVLFARDGAAATKVILLERGVGLTTIASYDVTASFVIPGSVGERYATWSVCGPFTCNVWWYDMQAADPVATKLKNADGNPQYAPVIDEAGGWIYFVRSKASCGAGVGIWRRPWPLDPDVAATRIRALKSGNDVAWTLSLDRTAAPQVNLWFSRYRCEDAQGDVVELPDVGA